MFEGRMGGEFGDTFGGVFRDFGRAWRWRGRSGFERGDIRLVMLALLQERPMHGYEVIRELERRFGGSYAPSPGTVYPTLQLLEDMGYVSALERDGKRVYSLTDAGGSHLQEHRQRVEEIWARVEGNNRRRYFEDADLRQEFAMFMTVLPMLMKRASPEQATRMRDVLARARREMEDIMRAEA